MNKTIIMSLYDHLDRVWLATLKSKEKAMRAAPGSELREKWLVQALAHLTGALRLLQSNTRKRTERLARMTNQMDPDAPDNSWQEARTQVLDGILNPSECIACETGGACFSLPCTHQALCKNCWEEWLPGTCPLCKANVTEIVTPCGHGTLV